MTKDVESGLEAVAVAAEATAISSSRGKQPAALEQRGGADRLSGNVVVNVRFAPDGLVCAVTFRPEHMSPQAWFDHLCRMAPQTYRALSGGRGSFCIGRDDFAVMSAAADTTL
jgi:hypothetical protein